METPVVKNMRKKIIIICLIAFLIFLLIQAIRYTPDSYVCRHMAHDQENLLEGWGVDTKIVRGLSKANGEGHVWIAIPLFGGFLHVDSIGWYPFIPETMYNNIQIFESFDDYANWKIGRLVDQSTSRPVDQSTSRLVDKLD